MPAPGVDVTEFEINASVPPPGYAAPASGRPAQLQLDFYATDLSPSAPPRCGPILIPGPQGKSQLKIADTSDTQSWTIGPCLAGIKVVVVTVRQAYPDPINHAPAGNVFVNSVALLKPRSPCNQT